MRIGMLGTGSVGQALATRLVELGHDVCMGSREPGNENASEWAKTAGSGASFGTFADAASFGELLFNCTAGAHSLEALAAAGEDAIADKVLVDVANPLDFSQGTLALTVTNTDSLAEQIQRAFPRARVVKALNTVNYKLMADPSILRDPHDLFLCGNDAEAKAQVTDLLASFGWQREHLLDLGALDAARGMEAYLLLWLRLSQFSDSPLVSVRVVH